MNLTDLAEVLRERAESPDTPQDARLAGVRAKVTASKRRRAVAGAACVVLALVGLVYAVIPGPDVRRSPPRPRTLASISAEFPEPATGLSADPADPTRRKEITVEWPGPSVVHARVNTPGKLRVLVNDVPVVDFSHWTYTVGGALSLLPDSWESGYGLKLAQGELVRITVIPERTTGDWVVAFTPR